MLSANKWDDWADKKGNQIDLTRNNRGNLISQALQTDRMQNYAEVAKAGQPYREQMSALTGEMGVKRFAADMDSMIDEWLKGLNAKAGKATDAAKGAGSGGLGGVGKGESVGTFFGYLAGQMGATTVNDQIADNTKRTADAKVVPPTFHPDPLFARLWEAARDDPAAMVALADWLEEREDAFAEVLR